MKGVKLHLLFFAKNVMQNKLFTAYNKHYAVPIPVICREKGEIK